MDHGRHELAARRHDGLPDRGEATRGTVKATNGLDWVPNGIALDEAYRLLPASARSEVERAIGGRPYTWWADVREAQSHYAAVGPAGFCAVWGPRAEGRWRLRRLRRAVDPADSRWFAESAQSASRITWRWGNAASHAPASHVPGPFAAFDPMFTDTFGLLPERTQAFFQEPLDGYPIDWAQPYWHVWDDGSVTTFQVWCYAAGKDSVSFAHGWKRVSSHGWRDWREAERPLARVPMQTRATWWMKPKVSAAPATAYLVLGVAPDASDADLRSRYRRLAKEVHPDTATGSKSGAARRFHEVQQAWAAVGTQTARAQYDAGLTRTAPLPPSIGRVGWWSDLGVGIARS